MSSIEALQSIAHDISVGFEALLERLEAQRKVEADLRQKLAKAVDRFNSNDGSNLSDGAFSEWQDEIVKQLLPSQAVTIKANSVADPEIERARDAVANLKRQMAGPSIRKCPVAHDSVTAETPKPQQAQRKCPVAQNKPTPTYEELERDFTTQGKPSSLECPFAARNNLADAAEDPIAAEFHADSLSAQSLDAARACGKCPIRFLDKHAPEEIAQYFEKHKHELPRSHEICVKRYQQNENSIRQLDAKYGNIVSMIQGLGNKHKAYLPSEDRSEQKSTAAVENWAKDVDGVADQVDIDTAQRVSHFEKPLRDVRLGESPSRPWGIHVPADRPGAPSAVSEPESINLEATSPSTGKPINNEATPKASSSRGRGSARSTRSRSRSRSRRPAQIVFNGPVFLGYSPDDASKLMSGWLKSAETS